MMMKLFLLLSCIGGIIPRLDSYELSVAAIFKNEAPYLKEWIEYHRLVGVEHFLLYNDASNDNYQEVLAPYIKEKIVTVIDWPVPSYLHFIPFQVEAYRDALCRLKGVTKWLALIDIDEFLLPAQEATVPACLAKHFSNASGVYINWFNFGTSGVYLKTGESLLFRLRACADPLYPRNSVGKSIVRPDSVQIDSIYSPHHFILSRGQYCDGDGRFLSFENRDLKLDGKVHNKHIRINHYTMRDEWFFHNIRLVRAKNFQIEEWLVWEHYHAFNQKQDISIVRFIMQHHRKAWEKHWGLRAKK